MSDRQNLKPYAALFFAGYAASRALFAAAYALIGYDCGCESNAVFVFAWLFFAGSLFGLTAVGSIALMRRSKLDCEICPSFAALIPICVVFWFSVPWVFGVSEDHLRFTFSAFTRYAPYASGVTAILFLISYFRTRRLGGLPSARVIK